MKKVFSWIGLILMIPFKGLFILSDWLVKIPIFALAAGIHRGYRIGKYLFDVGYTPGGI